MKITQHFTRDEFTRSQTATRQGIPNEPDERQWALIGGLCEHLLEPAREYVGPIYVSSGYRCPPLDRAIKNPPNDPERITFSDHIIRDDACAADIVAANLGDLFRFLYVQLPWSRLIWEYGRWVHVSYRAHANLGGRLAHRAVRQTDGVTLYRPMTFDEIYQLGRAAA